MPNLFPPELRWLLPKVRSQLRLHIGSFLCLMGASLLALGTPFSMRWLIDSILPARNAQLLIISVVVIFASYEGRAILNAFGGYLTFRATQTTALALRICLLGHLDSLSANYFDRTPVGRLLYPFDAPIDEISYFGSDLLPSILRAVIAVGVTFSAMVALDAVLALAVIPLIPAFLFLRYRYRNRIGQLADRVQTARSRFSSFLEEHLSGITQIQLLRQVEPQECRARELLKDTFLVQEALGRTGAIFSASSNLTIAAGIAATLALGSWMVFRNQLTIGTLVAFYSLFVQLFEPLTAAMEMYSRAQRTFSSVRQIRSVFEIAADVREQECARPLDPSRPTHIVLKGVSFSYREQKAVIRIPRLQILQGERVAIAGPNGAGKSTLAKLLARLYDVDSGEIVISGADVRAVTLASLRSAVCYLPAQPMLFHRSVANNLRIANQKATLAQVKRALELVGLRKFLYGYPDSLEVCVEPGASNLSSGERQRMAIARALLRTPRILILDETTSSLDPISEGAVLQMISGALPESTLVVVTHRLHSVSWMDRILLMQEGQIVGDGNHVDLKATNPFYAEALMIGAAGI